MGKNKNCWPGISVDEKAKVTANDTTTNYLDSKIVAGAGISKTVLNPGANETLEISAPGSTTDEKVKASATDTTPNYLDTKLAAGTNISLTKQNPAGNENWKIDCTATDINVKASATDTTPAMLDTKLTAGSGISLTKQNPAGNENWQIACTVSPATKMLWQVKLTPADFQLNGGAQLQNAASPVNSVRFWYIDFPEGSDMEVDIPMHPKYDGSGITLKCHWFCDDGSHGTEHTIKYYARYYRDTDSMDVGETQRSFSGWTDAASWVKYIDSVSSITVEGTYASAGTNLHLTIMHTSDCPASGNNRVLCVELQYYVTLGA